LDHPNIASLYEAYTDPKKIYIVTEHCGGGQLKQYIDKKEEPFSELDVAKIMNQIFQGLAYIHS